MAGIAGRAELTSRLTGAWAKTSRGGSDVMVLLGDAGIGKSSVLAWLAGQVGPSARTISCRGGDATPAMSTAAEIAAALAIPAPDTLRDESDALRAADILRAGLELARTTALLIDDIHDADPASRTALSLALRRATTTGVLVVITGRRVPAARTFAEGFDVGHLEGLPPDAAAGLLQAASDVTIAPEVTRQLLTIADGNPLALTRLPNALSPEHLSGLQPLPDDIPLRGDLHAVFTRQLPPPGTQARELLELAAVSADGSWSVIAAVRASATRALPQLEDLGLAHIHDGRLVLQHPLLRSAVLQAMPQQRWRALHLEFADLAELPDDVRLIHRACGSVGPDEALADAVVETARLTRLRGGTEAAARLLDRAVDLTADPHRRGQLQLEAAELLGTAGEATAARHRLEVLLADTERRDLHVAATLMLATLEAVDGAPAVAWQRLAECLAFAAPAELGPIHARIAVPLGMLGLVKEIVANAEAAVDHCKPHTPAATAARLVLAHAASAQDEGRADELVDALLPIPDLEGVVGIDPMVGLHVGRALSIAERYDAAAEALTALATQLRGEGARLALAVTFGALGETRIRSSRFDEAIVSLDEAIAVSLAIGQRAFAPFWLSLRGRVYALRGDDRAAAQAFELGFAISEEQNTFGARYFLLANAGLAALGAQRYDEAVDHLEECWAFEQTAGLLSPQLARWHPDLVEAYIAVGRHEEARPPADHLTAVAAAPGASRWTRATALRTRALLCADDDRTRALRLLTEAVAIYHPEIDAFDRARALLLLARLHRDEDQRAACRRDALYAFRRLGAAPWAAQVTPREQPPGIAGLTETEQRVLVEVAEGLTNRQIAKRLNMSTKTVANHLYHSYRKLGVASRTEAARILLLNQ